MSDKTIIIKMDPESQEWKDKIAKLKKELANKQEDDSWSSEKEIKKTTFRSKKTKVED